MKPAAVYFGGEEELERALYRRTMYDFFDASVRSEHDFLSRAEKAKADILARGQQVVQEIRPVLQAYRATRTALHEMERANRTNSAALAFLERLKEELDRLVPRDFVIRYESERLCRLPAYLDALTVRAQNGLLHLEKDKEKEAKVRFSRTPLGDYERGSRPLRRRRSSGQSKDSGGW
jgi:ATP-dependent helicase HrpA